MCLFYEFNGISRMHMNTSILKDSIIHLPMPPVQLLKSNKPNEFIFSLPDIPRVLSGMSANYFQVTRYDAGLDFGNSIKYI